MNALTPETMLKSAQDFMESRILLTAAELNFFTILKTNSLSADEISAETDCDLRALTMLLDALVAMGYLLKQENKYRCEEAACRFLTADSPGSILPMIRHMASLWQRWDRLTDIIRNVPGAKDTFEFTRDPDELQAFIGAMHVVSGPMAGRTVAAVETESSRALLDVGGGSGSYTIAFLKEIPEMKATLFDLPEVVEMARERLQDEGLLERTKLVAGNFHDDELPAGNDLALISAIIHSNSPEQNLDLYRKVYHSLDSGGRILIRDHVMTPDRVRPRSGAIFAINMLVATEGGGTYTYEEIERDLLFVGFTEVQIIKQGEQMDTLVEAFKP